MGRGIACNIETTAYFYNHKEKDKPTCRLYLDMKRKGKIQGRPDFILIMLNPGSAKPEKAFNDISVNVTLDHTLYRVRSLFSQIDNLNWIRVLNLSDLIVPKAKIFFEKIKTMLKTQKEHSIFHESRISDLKKFVKGNDKIYFACGVHPACAELLKTAKRQLIAMNANILNKTDKYYHPLARPNGKDIPDWRNQVIECIASEINDKSKIQLKKE